MENNQKEPAWVESLEKWYKEDEDRRSVMVIATDGVKAHCVMRGCSLPLIAAIKNVIKQDDDWKDIIKTAVLASENSL